MDVPAPADDALSQPTRARLFALLVERKQRTRTEELAETLGLHVNGVRRHLEHLSSAGLIERTKVRCGRGRPRDEWSIAAGANPGGEAPRSYADLAGWLARAISPGPARLRQVERTGREIGRELAPGRERSAEEFQQVLTAMGFQPDLETAADGTVHCRLCNCPYKDSVRENATVVCTLHKGLTAGLLDRIAPGARLAAFKPHDPDRAGCEVEVVGADWSREARDGTPVDGA